MVRALAVILILNVVLAGVARADDPPVNVRDAGDGGSATVQEVPEPFGPPRLRNLSPINTHRLTAPPGLPSLLEPGRYELAADVSWSNLWARQAGYDLDLDQVFVDLDSRIGVLPWLEVGIGLQIGYRGHAALAGLIQFWHQSFGYTERRDLRSPGLFVISRNGIDVFDGDDQVAFGIGNLTLRAKVPIAFDADGTTGASATLLLKLPVGQTRRGFGSAGLDVGLQVNGMLTEQFFTGYLGLGWVRMAQTAVWGFRPLAEHQFIMWLGVEFRFSREVALVATLDLQTEAVQEIETLAEPQMELHFGFAFRLSPCTRLWLSFLENTFGAENAIDMGWHVGISFRPQ